MLMDSCLALRFSRMFSVAAAAAFAAMSPSLPAGELSRSTPWTKHIITSGARAVTAVAADFTGDKRPDVISNLDGKIRSFRQDR